MSDPGTCARVRESVSAALDGESAPLDGEAVAAHLSWCRSCRRFRESAAAIRAAAAVRPAPVIGDRTDEVISAARTHRRGRLETTLRFLLAAIAIVEASRLAGALLFGDAAGVPRHLARHLGAFGVAFSVALLVVAIRPAQARALVPMTATLAAALVLAGIVGVVTGSATGFAEGVHLLEVVGLLLVWLLAVEPWWPRGDGHRRPAPPPGVAGLGDPATGDAGERRTG